MNAPLTTARARARMASASTAALGIWSMWTLAQTKTGSNLILASVSVRLKYFFIVTFCLNVVCASASP